MIDFEHVYKTYETHNDENVALEDINIHIDEGEFVFILGHSGAGKSTFLKLIQMEEKPTEGKVFINGQDLTRIKRRKVPYLRRQMGIIFQDFRLIPSMTVYENIAFALTVKFACMALGAVGIANMWLAVFADVGVMIIAVLNAIRALFVKNL
mgnify:CR=1 FL=1